MSGLNVLNSYASQSVFFTVDTISVPRTVGQSFVSPILTWIPVSQLGNLTGNGVQVTYDVSAVAGTTVTFVSAAQSDNPLTITNPSSGVYVIRGILNVLDYNAAMATINPPSVYTGNVAYSAAYVNTNGGTGNFNVSFVGVP